MKVKEPSMPDYLPIADGKIVGSIFPQNVLALCEMQTAMPRIWTRFLWRYPCHHELPHFNIDGLQFQTKRIIFKLPGNSVGKSP